MLEIKIIKKIALNFRVWRGFFKNKAAKLSHRKVRTKKGKSNLFEF